MSFPAILQECCLHRANCCMEIVSLINCLVGSALILKLFQLIVVAWLSSCSNSSRGPIPWHTSHALGWGQVPENSSAGLVPLNGTPRRSSAAPAWQLSGCCTLLRPSKSRQKWELSVLSLYLEQHNLKADYVSLWRLNDLKFIKKSYPTVDYHEECLAMHFVSEHAVALCGNVGQNKKTNILFIWNDWVGERIRSKR